MLLRLASLACRRTSCLGRVEILKRPSSTSGGSGTLTLRRRRRLAVGGAMRARQCLPAAGAISRCGGRRAKTVSRSGGSPRPQTARPAPPRCPPPKKAIDPERESNPLCYALCSVSLGALRGTARGPCHPNRWGQHLPSARPCQQRGACPRGGPPQRVRRRNIARRRDSALRALRTRADGLTAVQCRPAERPRIAA